MSSSWSMQYASHVREGFVLNRIPKNSFEVFGRCFIWINFWSENNCRCGGWPGDFCCHFSHFSVRTAAWQLKKNRMIMIHWHCRSSTGIRILKHSPDMSRTGQRKCFKSSKKMKLVSNLFNIVSWIFYKQYSLLRQIKDPKLYGIVASFVRRRRVGRLQCWQDAPVISRI